MTGIKSHSFDFPRSTLSIHQISVGVILLTLSLTIFVAKFNPGRFRLIYSTYLGGKELRPGPGHRRG